MVMFLTLATADVHNLTKVNEGGYHVSAADMPSHRLAPTSIRGKVECGLFCLQSAACAGFTHLHNSADNNNCILYDNLANITINNNSNINNISNNNISNMSNISNDSGMSSLEIYKRVETGDYLRVSLVHNLVFWGF